MPALTCMGLTYYNSKKETPSHVQGREGRVAMLDKKTSGVTSSVENLEKSLKISFLLKTLFQWLSPTVSYFIFTLYCYNMYGSQFLKCICLEGI